MMGVAGDTDGRTSVLADPADLSALEPDLHEETACHSRAAIPSPLFLCRNHRIGAGAAAEHRALAGLRANVVDNRTRGDHV